MGGAGLNLGSGGNLVLKAGLGSRVSFIGPTYLDVMVGSHWIQDPGSFQYVDARLGLGFTFDLTSNGSTSKPAEQAPPPSSQQAPKAAPTAAAPAPIAAPTQPVTLMATPTVAVEMASPTPTPEELTLEEPSSSAPVSPKTLSGPVPAVKALKRFYKAGMKAFLGGKYDTALKYLRKSLAVKEVHGAAYYYAETYATIGVIYHFHSKVKNHRHLAYINYQKALKIDPTTKAAKKYIKLLKSPSRKARHMTKPKPTPPSASADSGSSMSIDTGAASGPSNAGSGNSAPTGSSDSSGGSAPATISTGGKIIDNN
jgi:hypothetical protein